MAKKSSSPSKPTTKPELPEASPEAHPDYIGAIVIDEGAAADGIPNPDGPPFPTLPPIPRPIPLPPIPIPRFCAPVSGRYSSLRIFAGPGPVPFPRLDPIVTVRVDVDRFYPQNRISIEFTRRLPRSTTHVIAEVTSDQCLALNRRRIEAQITYRDGDPALIPGNRVVFEASRGRGVSYGNFKLTLSGSGSTQVYDLKFESTYFDPVEFEVDRVDNAGTAVTSYDTHSHPNRPSDLPNETVSLTTVYQRAGFDVRISPNESLIPTADAGANGTWSDSEMHNAMVTYWSRFADAPQWAMWVLYAAQHDQGRSLGGIMFDDIGSNHRQGTAIFTDSFIQDVPSGDANPAAWRQRMVFWTAVHEMGHAFNLAHAWQKTLGTPWTTVVNEPEGRSFMNYPFRVSGGQSSFYSDFRFRFTDQELLFMRHAPRRFVQMGNSNWFENHGFEAPTVFEQTGRWKLDIRPNRDLNSYQFLEPVVVEIKLTNTNSKPEIIDDHLLSDGRHIAIFVQREGGLSKRWRPFVTHCHEEHAITLKPSEAAYASHTISMAPEGWLIDEPGFYKVQAVVETEDEVVLSNVLRIFVAPSSVSDENKLAPDYFTENVGRAIAFAGAPTLADAVKTLHEIVDRCPENPAAVHATMALAVPLLYPFKVLDVVGDKGNLAIKSMKSDVTAAAKTIAEKLIDEPDSSAETMGHIDYFQQLEGLAECLADSGNEKGARKVMQSSISTMKKRGILPAVVHSAEKALSKLT